MVRHLFTSGSVFGEHPDKIADRISDAVLDATLEQGPEARIACKTYIKTGMILVGGEITTSAWVDIKETTCNTVHGIGYVHPDAGFDADSCVVLSVIGKQSSDINQGIDRTDLLEQGAGDQGLMFGYTTNETDVLVPASITYAHRLIQCQTEVCKNGTLSQLCSDVESQVTFQYDDGEVVGISVVMFFIQHSEETDQKSLQEAIMEEIIGLILSAKWPTFAARFFINPIGRFIIGDPVDDCGLTGRKVIVDTYGDIARRGGGASSSKDLSEMDHSAAYTARYVARNIAAADLADCCEIQVSYVTDVAEPISIMIETFGTEKMPPEQLTPLACRFFGLRPYGLVQMLDLLRPIYKEAVAHGHFGREYFPQEKIGKTQLLRDAAGLK